MFHVRDRLPTVLYRYALKLAHSGAAMSTLIAVSTFLTPAEAIALGGTNAGRESIAAPAPGAA
jgi:hypothetical protein